MAKHNSKRASRKRAYKKRRTIRKIQRGGTSDEKLINLIMTLLPVVLPDVLTNLNVFIKILSIILGSGVIRGGSKFSREQRGGGGLSAVAKQQLLTELGKLKASFQTDPAVSNCIDRFITKYQAEPVVAIPSDVVIDPITINPEELVRSEITVENPAVAETTIQPNESTIDKIKRIFAKGINGMKSKIDSQIEGLFQKIKAKSGMNPEDIACLETLKAKVLADMSGKVGDSIEKVKDSAIFLRAIEMYEAAKNLKEKVNVHLSTFVNNTKEGTKTAVSNGLGRLGNDTGNFLGKLAVGAFNGLVLNNVKHPSTPPNSS